MTTSGEAAEAAARRSYGKLVAFLAARTGDVAAAEDALADAFAAALADGPARGVPANPEAWLLTAARRKLIDAGRRRAHRDASAGELRRIAEELEAAEPAALPDHRLGLMLACAHPDIDRGVRAPLILQAVLGLGADRIASAFLTSPAAMAQRLVRAKARIREAGVPFEVPGPEALRPRLAAVLDAVYAAYAEGWTDAAGSDATRRDLAAEALFLAGLVARLLPDDPEALGLYALMLYAEARQAARRDDGGDYVPLARQDTALWDEAMIAEAEGLLRRAQRLGAVGRYQLEAALQSAHVQGRRSGLPDTAGLLVLYDALLALTGSPVVALNRALAIADAQGPDAALVILDDVEARLSQYQPYWAARAALLERAGRTAEAARAYDLAIGLEADEAVRRYLRRRQGGLARS